MFLKTNIRYLIETIGVISILLMTIGCNDKPISDTKYHVDDNQQILFPIIKKPKEKDPVYMQALLQGQLVLNGECLQIKTSYLDNTILYDTPIWPHNYHFEIENGVLNLKEGDDLVATLGGNMKIGGGQMHTFDGLYNYKNLHEILSQCPPPYWLATPDSVNKR